MNLDPGLDTARTSARGRRASNEDAVATGEGYALIADGVGGGPDGGRAAALAVDAGEAWLAAAPGDPLAALLALPVVAADALATADPPLHPAAATGLAAARVRGGIGYAVAIGDCRVTVLRRGLGGVPGPVSSTADHDGLALAARDVVAALHLGRQPEVLAADAAADAGRRLLDAVRVHGPRRPPVPVVATPLEPGDVLLLTTDGVHDVLGSVGVQEVLVELGPQVAAEHLSQELVRRALALGSRDNCTAAVVVVPGGAGADVTR